MADEEYDDTYYAPVLANNNGARTLTFQTRMLNQHLVCQLCMGYFNDACTIIECLHTFCRVCIDNHFQESHFCPVCEKNLGPNPNDHVRTDRTIQSIVEKVFPQFSRQPERAPSAPAEDEQQQADDEEEDGPLRKRAKGGGSDASGGEGEEEDEDEEDDDEGEEEEGEEEEEVRRRTRVARRGRGRGGGGGGRRRAYCR